MALSGLLILVMHGYRLVCTRRSASERCEKHAPFAAGCGSIRRAELEEEGDYGDSDDSD